MAAASNLRLLALPGDGIGPEVVAAALSVLETIRPQLPADIIVTQDLIGGVSVDACGVPISDATLTLALAADAVLVGAVGGAKWDALPIERRPERGLIRLRREMDVFANLRPAKSRPEIADASTLRAEHLIGLDLVVVRELTSGVYFGEPRGREDLPDGGERAYDTQAYTTLEIERVGRVAFELARTRTRTLCSVDKANVMETGRLWRETIGALAFQYPDVSLSHMYADNCAMQLMRAPTQFDVIVTDNLFGDILSDAAAMLAGSLGLLPSASLSGLASSGRSRGLYEPVHGAAPDIAGKGLANPIATILSLAMCLRHSMDAGPAADAIERAVDAALQGGARTADLVRAGQSFLSTSQMTATIISALNRT